MPESFVPGFKMVDYRLYWRDLDSVEEFGDPPLLKREVIGKHLDAGADQRLKLRSLC